MINLNDIRGSAAITYLVEYKGINPYLKKLRNDYLKNKKVRLTDTQEQYIIDNHDKEPLLVNRVVKITQYLGEQLQKQHELKFTPERILIEYILGENDRSFHVYGKLKRNQLDSGMYWLPKTQVLDDPYFEEINIDVDFTTYNNVLSKQKKKLYQHQEQGVKFLLSRNGCILADDMGLGKSIQSIIAAEECSAKKILVISPASVKINWQREINLFCDETVVIDGNQWKTSKYTIINYDILKNFHTIEDKTNEEKIPLKRNMVDAKFDLVIIDEAHCVKDSKANRSKIINDIVINFGIPKVWLLTGTPVANRPIDFFNLLKLIKSPIANNWDYFTKRYCGAKTIFTTLKNGKKKKVRLNNGATNLDELAQKTKNILLRRLKSEVLDMPKKLIIPVYHELSNSAKKEYDELWDNYLIERKKKKKRGSVDKDLVEVILLRKFIAMETVSKTIELVNNALEMDKKVIIFTSFTDELMELHEHFGKISVIHYGGMSNSAKQESVDAFQNNEKIRVFIGNEVSAGVGITLTKATVVVFNSFAWVPGLNEQAEDRCIFEGQLILTNDGYKKIEDVNIGDLVYTHNGNFKPVFDKHTHLERKKARVDINAFGFTENLSVTDDHKIYVYNIKDSIFEWIESKNLDIFNHKLTFKVKNQPINRKEYLDLNNYVDNKFINNFGIEQKNGRLINLPEKVELTNELLYAFGFFIAEGWANDFNDKKSAIVSVCQKIDNKKMYDAAKYIIDVITKSFNIDNYSEYIDKNDIKVCTIHSKNLAKNFIDWFGKSVSNKKLPIWIDELNDEQLTYLIDGFNHGDGYLRGNEQSSVTVSPLLGSQLVRYNANLGRCVRLRIINGDENDYYSIEYNTKESNLNKIEVVDDFITYPIRSLHFSKPKRGEERVYDLSVKDDHSFVVGNYNVHNCYRLGQNEDVNVYYQMFINTISTRMYDTVKEKQEVISTIVGDKKMTEEELTEIMMDQIMMNNLMEEDYD